MDSNLKSVWPDDADGDVLRRMDASGFDFNNPVDIDFNVDLDSWPPADELVSAIELQYSRIQFYASASGDSGYILVVINAVLNYDLVISVQQALSDLATPFGGVCESWGVLH
ncbi:Regulator of ribonuclease activity B [Duganella sp. CF402]|uniref:ribonuclease E inhibitor RraB n=1 Tax=unclassified Duganella TaxID=2636909 RepID=UPI0008CA87A4|nr:MULTISPECIES: ribonuclease E inhibitor RraB [unclassified Duganella]RZT05794.1 regulator of ribonuclease activity B [Duganella sp. BK701]SEM90958.1 Regulator of ribonuclease activity B [Duganella sp. CF402]